ncbi:MAG: hypothetical protein IPN36_06860 [Bacteroidetes bacterium]|nr:hypothetical protein [Bacteroidota bacterium]
MPLKSVEMDGEGKAELTHTYSINMQSQWLNSWYNYGDHQSGEEDL